MTICKCSKCGKELHKTDSDFCGRMNVTECSECRYLQIISADTITSYNAYLRRNQTDGKQK